MSLFSEAMSAPLPSKVTDEENYFDDTYLEYGDVSDVEFNDVDDVDDIDTDGPFGMEGCCAKESDDNDIDDLASDLDDIDDVSDEDLDDLEKELERVDDEESVADVEEVNLTPQEEEDADDMMQLAATTELINSEMNAQERAAFAESAEDTRIAISEGFLLESDIQEIYDSSEPFMESKMYAKTKVQFGKEDRKKQLYGVAVNVSAKSHNDPDYYKYLKCCALKRKYKQKLSKKYHGEAIKRMKVYFQRLKSSKSGILSKLGKQVSK